ncbi:eCIS core domain-containing protein [Mucilaginibacter jinjuensis]|uniref:DUF4157 domain-containing protein n=1 Tax=Mucilaginibacter jinjuensis TaxID=1176721 RepID=A0ABY7T3R9_9SPHI|nr:DUF4157 domain-containing protein [Mucilaginibacter jinjuensis]WCT10371.1 DUF4157 domain-containing protein [Mucilaginibacter jinjuensis]
MHSTAEKTVKPTHVARKQDGPGTFFRKAGEDSFFGNSKEQKPSFFSPSVQAKLTVSQPDDPYEKEADHVAESVMSMPEPVAASTPKDEPEKVQLKEEEQQEEVVQPKLQSPQITALQRKKDDATVQPKLSAIIQRSEDSNYETVSAGAGCDSTVQCRANNINIQRSGRAPPQSTGNFESSLSNSNGSGSALPDSTRSFMEGRFNANFGDVRIHTGSTAETLSRDINAQAFTHGNNIYFNSGKYSPHTVSGGQLLAHELTHTIQQGAVKTNSNSTIARKPMIQRAADGAASIPQLNNAIAKAKAEEGKVNANKDGDDGFRVGWQRLLEFFKTTFGAERIVLAGGAAAPGTVPEENIKKRNKAMGMKPNQDRPSAANTEMRDAMPSWCGIFVFWALNKGGVPMPKWQLGGQNIKLDSARPPGSAPQPGDIAYRNAFSHFALVEKVSGGTVTTVNGNTSGEDNLGAQIQTKDHPLNNWTAFFDPIRNKTGELGSGEAAGAPPQPKTMKELRKQLFNVDRKAEYETESDPIQSENFVQAKSELSNWSIDASANPVYTPPVQTKTGDEKLQAKEEEKQDEKHIGNTTEHALQRKGGEGFEQASAVSNDPVILAENASSIENSSAFAVDNTNHTPSIQKHEEAAEDSRGPPVIQQKTETSIQRNVIDDALNFIGSVTDCITIDLDEAKKCALQKARQVASHIPGYRALGVILGSDPITGEHIEQNGRNFIQAAFDVMPGGDLLYRKLDEIHQLDAAAAWIDTQIATVSGIVADVSNQIDVFWNHLGASDLLSPLDVLRHGANIVLGFIDKIVTFAISAAAELLKMVKDYLLTKIVDFIKTQTPAYPLLTVILGKDPITEQKVERNGTNILNALLELGGEEGREQRKQMQDTGSFKKVADYIDRGIAIFGDAYDQIVQGFKNIWDHVSISSLMDPVGTFTMIYNQFAAPVSKVLAFVLEVGAAILRFIKEVLMVRLANWAKTVRGYSLVTVIIGKDPFTGQDVPRTTENLIKGFMSLMDGGEQQFEQLKQSGAIDRTAQKVTAAVARLNMTPQSIIQLFTDLWNSFSLNDLVHPIDAFQRILAKFGEPIGRLIAFVFEIIKIVIETILIVMNFPFDLINNIIAKAMQAIELIKADPIGFLKNLLRAIKEGFMQFFNNILTHLWNGLKTWFLSEVEAAGIPIPTDFSLMGIIKWLLVVLDITMEKIWKKLEDRIGKEKVDRIKAMIARAEQVASAVGEAYEFIKDVQERGFMAVIADKIKEKLSNVWEMVLDAVKSFVMDQIINKVTAKILSMLDPTGIMAVINSAIAIYKAIQSFIRYLRQMLEIVNSFVEGTLEIAQGNTKKAADFLERSLARGVPIVIGFLANQVGLNLSERLKDALEIVRAKVDVGLTWVIDRVVTIVERLVDMGRNAVNSVLTWLGIRKQFRLPNGEDHTLKFSDESANKQLMIESTPVPLEHYIANMKARYTTPAAITQFAIIDAKIAAINTEKAETMNAERGRKIQGFLTEISTAMQDPAFGGNEIVPPTHVDWAPATVLGGPVGHVMTAQPLSFNPGPYSGSEPSSSGATELWEKVKVRQGSYVQGHLLNHHVHGSGGLKENLVPIRGPFNTQMETNVETVVKNRVIGNKEVLYYRVEAVFGGQPNRVNVPEEGLLPTQLLFDVKTMRKKAGATGATGTDWEIDPASANLAAGWATRDHVLDPDSPPAVAAMLDAATLLANATTELGTTPSLTYSQFKNKTVINQRSLEVLETAGTAGAITTLFATHHREADKNVELALVTALPADQVTTWTGFKANRVFYDIADTANTEVQTAFNNKQNTNKTNIFNNAQAAITSAPKTMLWRDFKRDHNMNFNMEAASPEQARLTAIQDAFETHINS